VAGAKAESESVAWRGVQRRKGRERSLGETLVEDIGRFHAVAKLQDLRTMWTRMLTVILMDARSPNPSPSVEVQLDPTAGQARLFAWGLCAALFVLALSKLKFILLFDCQTLSSSMCGHNIQFSMSEILFDNECSDRVFLL
jgi:hypothetical protein